MFYLKAMIANSAEMGDGGCDYGSSKSDLTQEYPHHDFSLVKKEAWWTNNENLDQVSNLIVSFPKT